jgi:hypothetical protein
MKQTEIKQILKHKIIGIVGEQNAGKTTVLIELINKTQIYKCNKVAFFYHEKYKKNIKGIDKYINNIEELLYIENSIIFVDEFKYIFNLDDRHQKRTVESVLNMIEHNNNILILCGLPSYYKQLISKHVKHWLLKKFKFKDCVNGSSLKQYSMSLQGEFNGGIGLNIKIDKVLSRHGLMSVLYDSKTDKKSERINLFVLKTTV